MPQASFVESNVDASTIDISKYQDKDAFFAWLKSLIMRLPIEHDGGYTDYLKAVCEDPENFDPQDQEFILANIDDLEGYCVKQDEIEGKSA